MSKTYSFSIPIGDWSDDGHGKCEYFYATATKPFKDVCLAFKAAKKKLDFSPEEVCSEYEENEVTEEAIELLKEHGFEIDSDNFYTREMAELVVWFLNQGDSELNAVLLPEDEEPPMLRNWDYRDITGENLDGFGYGLFGS